MNYLRETANRNLIHGGLLDKIIPPLYICIQRLGTDHHSERQEKRCSGRCVVLKSHTLSIKQYYHMHKLCLYLIFMHTFQKL